MIAKILSVGAIALLVISCKKESDTNLQQKLAEGETPTTLLNDYPLDSFYGKEYAGGYIFYIQSNGTGMVADKTDLTANGTWGCYGMSLNGADDATLGSGKLNTDSIVAQCSETTSAAVLCVNSTEGGYSDWYLPSEDELFRVYDRLASKGIGNFASNYYWSSTEIGASSAQHMLFTNGSINFSTKSNLHYVRAIRNF